MKVFIVTTTLILCVVFTLLSFVHTNDNSQTPIFVSKQEQQESSTLSRWPPSRSYLTNNVSERGWERFPSTRVAVINIFSTEQSSWLLKTEHDNDKHFFGPQKQSLDRFIFYTIYPENAQLELYTAIQTLKWKESPFDFFDRFPQLNQLLLDRNGMKRWVTEFGSTVYTIPIVINLPMHFEQNAGLLLNNDWLRCSGMRWTLKYALFTSVVVNQLLDHPLTTVGYDYILRFDFDLHFFKPVPYNLFEWMSSRDCSIGHSSFEHGGIPNGCQHQSPELFEQYARENSLDIASIRTDWFYDESALFYGNFQVFATYWFQSPENIKLAKWLWNKQENNPYFKSRFTDQGVILRMFGMKHFVMMVM